jgi:hypothetical protein
MLYPSELLARSRRSSIHAEGATRGNFNQHWYSIRDDSGALGRIPGGRAGGPVQPFARDLISRASFSISSVFRNMAMDSTWTESVFSTSAFSSLARS